MSHGLELARAIDERGRVPRLVFVNLAIDQLWDTTGQLKRIFPARIPQSEVFVRGHEDLGIYLSQPGDLILSASTTLSGLPPPLSFSHGAVHAIAANPYDQQDWLQTALKLIPNDQHFELWPCSISPLERQLLKERPLIQLPPWLPPNFDAGDFNRKSKIFKWSKMSHLRIPPSAMTTTQRVLAGDSPTPYPHYIKAEWGSGGGGNFYLKSANDNSIAVLRRQLSPEDQSPWLMQTAIENSKNYSAFGFACDAQPLVMAIDYDSHGFSYRHRLTDEQGLKPVHHAFQKIAQYLSDLGYRGPVGFDVVKDPSSHEFFLVDVNVRWTKSHLIAIAASRLGVDLSRSESLRFRHRGSVPQPNLNQLKRVLTSMGGTLDPSRPTHWILPYSFIDGTIGNFNHHEISFFSSQTPTGFADQFCTEISQMN